MSFVQKKIETRSSFVTWSRWSTQEKKEESRRYLPILTEQALKNKKKRER